MQDTILEDEQELPKKLDLELNNSPSLAIHNSAGNSPSGVVHLHNDLVLSLEPSDAQIPPLLSLSSHCHATSFGHD